MTVVVAWCGVLAWDPYESSSHTNGYVAEGLTGAWWAETSGWVVTEREVLLTTPKLARALRPGAADAHAAFAGGVGELGATVNQEWNGTAVEFVRGWEQTETGRRMSAGGWGAAPAANGGVQSLAAGWPWRAVWSYRSDEYRARPVGIIATPRGDPWSPRWYESIELPYLPVWRGVAAGSVFYGAAWSGVFAGVAGLRRWRRRRWRGRCRACGYDLIGLRSCGDEGVVCPECGERTLR